MINSPLPPVHTPGLIPRVVGICMVPIILGLGCSQTKYRAADLPRQFAAPAEVNYDAISLVHLDNPSFGNERIDWGDVLDVTVDSGLSTSASSSAMIRVARDGSINVPIVGRVHVAGLEVEQAEQEIAAAAQSRNVYPNPYVSVMIEQLRMNRIAVGGAVEKPGTYELPRGSTSLAAALVAANGLSDDAGVNIEIRRADGYFGAPGSLQANRQGVAINPRAEFASHQSVESSVAPTARIIQVNLLSPSTGSDGYVLSDGDVVNVAKRPTRPIYVLGLVNDPGEFELPSDRDLRLLDALALAGGCSNQVADKIMILRRLPGQESAINISASIQKARRDQGNLSLAAGDTIVVEQTPQTVMIDVLKNFLRFGVSSSVPLF